MGRQSREHRERRERRAQMEPGKTNPDQNGRINALEDKLKDLGGDAVSWSSRNLPADVEESNLEDIVAFESVGSGPSLFEGLQQHGLELPPPGQLNEQQSAKKAKEVLHALARIRIMLVGFSHMSPCELYRTLWHQTLWEGCYVEKRNPGALTFIDVSHRMSRSDWKEMMESLKAASTVH
jgi:hypothetical protein